MSSPVDRRARPVARVPALLAAVLLTGCAGTGIVQRSADTASPPDPPASSASVSPTPEPSASSPSGPSGSAAPGRTPSIPADGLALAAYGYTNGPVAQFSLPRGSFIVSSVDQTNNVVAVISSPAPDAVANYLRQTLPATGFSIDRDDRATRTMTFSGHGWSGSFAGSASTSAVLLRPN